MKILIVDDEQLIRQGLRMIIEGSGFPADQVLEAGSGREAVRMAGEAWPEIILMDVKMPGMDGLSALREIKRVLPDTQAVILTAYGLFEYAQEAVRCGAREYLLKPVNPEDLTRVLNDCLERASDARRRREKENNLTQDLLHTKATIETELVWDLISGIGVSRQRIVERLRLIRPEGSSCWFGDQVLPETCLVMEDTVLPDLSVDNFRVSHHLIKQRLMPSVAAMVEGRLVVLTASGVDINQIRVLRQDIFRRTGCALTVGVGGPDKSGNNIFETYLEALEALGCALGHGREAVWQTRACHSDYGRELFRALLVRNRKTAGAYKGRIISQLAASADELHRDMLFNILSSVYHTVRDTGADRWAAGTFFCRQAKRLSGNFSPSKAEEWLNQVIEDAFGLVKNPDLDRNRQITSLAANFIRKNYQKPLTLEEVARVVYLSPTYFSAVFKQQTGLSFSRYLNKIRVEKAKELLTGSGRPVSEIARAVGYLEGNYFCRVFKKMTGTTPGEYRRA